VKLEYKTQPAAGIGGRRGGVFWMLFADRQPVSGGWSTNFQAAEWDAKSAAAAFRAMEDNPVWHDIL